MEEEFYNVEKILKKRLVGKKLQYFVKWEGYDIGESTWEPVKNLENVKHMIEEYENNLNKDKQPKSPQKSSSSEIQEIFLQKRSMEKRTQLENQLSTEKKLPSEKKQSTQKKQQIRKHQSTQNDLQLTSGKGSFELGDRPHEVIGQKLQQDGQILLEIEWVKRENGEWPMNSMLTNRELRHYAPQFLLDFYESKICYKKAQQHS